MEIATGRRAAERIPDPGQRNRLPEDLSTNTEDLGGFVCWYLKVKLMLKNKAGHVPTDNRT